MFVGHTLKPRAFDFKRVIEHPDGSDFTSQKEHRDHQQLNIKQLQYIKKLNFTLVQKKNGADKKMMEYQSKRAKIGTPMSTTTAQSSSQIIFSSKKNTAPSSQSQLPEVVGKKKTSHQKQLSPLKNEKINEEIDGRPQVKIVDDPIENFNPRPETSNLIELTKPRRDPRFKMVFPLT